MRWVIRENNCITILPNKNERIQKQPKHSTAQHNVSAFFPASKDDGMTLCLSSAAKSTSTASHGVPASGIESLSLMRA